MIFGDLWGSELGSERSAATLSLQQSSQTPSAMSFMIKSVSVMMTGFLERRGVGRVGRTSIRVELVVLLHA